MVASAAAVAWPSGAPAASGAPGRAAFSAITTHSGQTVADRGTQQTYLAVQQFRAIAEHQTMATMVAHQQAVAHQAAVAQAAKRQAQAELTAKQEAAGKAAQQGSGRADGYSAARQADSGQQCAHRVWITPVDRAGHAGLIRLVRQPVLLPGAAVGRREWLERDREQSVHRGLRHPAGDARLEDGQRRPRLAGQRGHPDPLGPGYIKSTYGSPCVAWSHEEADGWY